MPYAITYNCAKGTNPNYLVHIAVGGNTAGGFEIIADVPEEFSTAVASEYESLLPSSFGSLFTQGAEALAKAVAGSSFNFQYLSQQIWVNTSPIELSLSLQFDAKDDALNNVYNPMRALELLCMPSSTAGILYAPPGANRGWALGGSVEIDVSVGKFKMTDAIFVSVQSTFDQRLTKEGYPIAGKSDISIRSSRILSREDWAAMTGVSALSSVLVK